MSDRRSESDRTSKSVVHLEERCDFDNEWALSGGSGTMFEPRGTSVHQVGHFARTAKLSHHPPEMHPEQGLLEPLGGAARLFDGRSKGLTIRCLGGV